MKDQSNEMTQERYHEYMLRMLREVDEDSSLNKKNQIQNKKTTKYPS